MKSIRAAIVFGFLSLFVLPTASNAITYQTYTFSSEAGNCGAIATPCSGTLVLQNYIEGDDLALSNFVSFTFSIGSSTSGLVQAGDLNTFYGSLGPAFPGPYDVAVESSTVNFQSFTDGAYEVDLSDAFATGYGHEWNNGTPLPAALPLFASGFAGLGWLAARRRKPAAPGIG